MKDHGMGQDPETAGPPELLLLVVHDDRFQLEGWDLVIRCLE